jgi:hypothetical protein
MSVEHELGEFAARGQAIAPEARHHGRTGFSGDRETSVPHAVVDQDSEVTFAVGVAGQGEGARRAFA